MNPADDSRESEQRIIEALLSDRGLQALVDTAARELGNPLVVVDPSYHNMATAGIFPTPNDSSTFAQVMRDEMGFGDILEESIAHIQDEKIDDLLARTPGPLVRHNSVLDEDTMTQSVVVHGITLAHVMLVAHTHPFKAGDTMLFSLACRAIGQEIQKGALATTNTMQIESYFLRRLLEDEAPNPDAIQRRLALLEIEPLAILFVVVLQPISHTFSSQHEQNLRAQLGSILTNSLSTSYEGNLVLLLSRLEGNALSEFDLRVLKRVAADNQVYIGVSNAFDDICEVRRHLTQAKAAINFGSTYTKILDDPHVYLYCDYTLMELLDFANDHVDLLNYVHPAIRSLYDHDAAHSSELVETLYAYMQNGTSTARTAKLLNLHKNTLLYRLGRIREITGNDLSSGEDLFLFHLSIRTLIYLGLLQIRTKPQASDKLHDWKN